MDRVAAIQMCSSHIIEENLATAASLIAQAASNNAKLVVLPEMFPIMGKKATDKVQAKEAYRNGKIQKFLSDQSKKHEIWIVGGTIPITCSDESRVSATSLVFDDKGAEVGRYDKIHLFDASISESESYRESDTTNPGNKLEVVDTPVGKLGLSVCYDIRFPSMFTELSNLGAEIIVIPAAFTMKTGKSHWKLLARSRAVENFCYVIGSCQVGLHSNGRETYGHSLIVDPWGDVLEEARESLNSIIYSDIDLVRLHQIRNSMPVLEHRKIKFDFINKD